MKGVVANTTTSGKCANEGSVYINFQPSYFSFEFTSSFGISNITQTQPHFIHESQFGIVKQEVQIYQQHLDGILNLNAIFLENMFFLSST